MEMVSSRCDLPEDGSLGCAAAYAPRLEAATSLALRHRGTRRRAPEATVRRPTRWSRRRHGRGGFIGSLKFFLHEKPQDEAG